jgi:signal transduction histidine kinase
MCSFRTALLQFWFRLGRFPQWIAVMSGLGLLLSFALFFVMRGWEQRAVDRAAADLVGEQVEKLQVTILRSMEVLHSIAALHRARGSFDRAEFREFVKQSLRRQPELQALSWNPVVPAACRAIIEARAAAEGITDFAFREQPTPGRFIAEGARSDYVPVYFIEPQEKNFAALGFDLASDPVRREAMERALSTGEAIATTPLRLAQEPRDSAGLLVLLPVYRDGPPDSAAARRDRVEGFAVAVFRVADLASESFRQLQNRGIDAALFNFTPGDPPIFSLAPAKSFQPTSAVPLDVAGRRWTVGFAPNARFLTGRTGTQSWLALTGGICFTLLTTFYLWNGWRQSRAIATANAALQDEIVVRKRAEAEAASANQAKSDFLASMSHEIRTPLNAILGYSQLMQRDRDLPSDHRDAVRGISASGEHLLGLINEVLDLSKIEAGRMEVNSGDFDLQALACAIATTFKPLCAQKRIRFRSETEFSGAVWVCGDEGKLRQILINLLGNAVKFTMAGEVALCIRCPSVGCFLFEVFDTGLGIPEEERNDIFKPFHQGSGAHHHVGTGLGLAIAQRQVELLGGNLELQSERGVGSRFHFSIPLDTAAARKAVSLSTIERLAPGSIEPKSPPRPSRVVLPELLCARLGVAAELHSTTALKNALRDLRETGPEAQWLAEQIRELMRSYDMDGIQRLLTEMVDAPATDSTVSHGAPAPS